jgi:thiol-disulfide isomerase/thioredoxin
MRRALAVAALAGLLLAACADGRRGTADGEPTSLLPTDRLALPQFDLARFQALLDELRGTPVVVNIWGSWCPPCRDEAPDLARVSGEYQDRVQFVGVDILDARAPARDFIRRYDWPYPSVFDPAGAIRDGLGYVGQPVTLVYDRDGGLSFVWQGTITAELLRREIRKVL